MNSLPCLSILLAAVFALSPLNVVTAAGADTPQSCFESKDKACLETIYKDITTNPDPSKTEAMYLHGRLFLDEEDFEAAKNQFEMAEMFGDGERSKAATEEIIRSGKVKLTSRDCFIVDTEQCFLDVAESNPKKAPVAYYHLGGYLRKSDPEKAKAYTIKAAEMGHETAQFIVKEEGLTVD